jgi:TRAP transporter 4TM/12TM fusion protein
VSKLSSGNTEKIKTDIFAKRKLQGVMAFVASGFGALIAIFIFYTAFAGAFPLRFQRATLLMIIIPLIFLRYPFGKKSPLERASWNDIFLVLVSVASFAYILIDHERMITRMKYADPVLPLDYVFGTLSIILVLEATRRTLGWILVITTVVFLGYTFAGPHIPGILSHAGTSYGNFIAHIYLTEEGIFNIMTGIASTFLFTFVAFGTFLKWSGVDKYYMDLCLSLAGKARGGPAKVAVISSALMGTITGSTMSNVATTGALTIPMMKDIGYEPHEAAAIETASSTGGALAPPMMGAGVFIMSELTGIPLITILMYSVLPAILYFVSIYFFVEIMARKHGLKGLTEHSIPNLKDVLMKSAHLFVPLIVLVTLLLKGFTPFLASASCCVLTVVMSQVRRDTRMGIVKIFNTLDDCARNMLTITAVSACAALIMGVITLTGLIMKITSLLVSAAHGIVLLALFLLAAISYVIGMGMPVTLSYILVATLGAPALSELGVPIIVAHLAIFWYSQDSTITPPVCMTAFVAAQIAKAKSFMRVGFITVKIAKGLYIIPLLFVYTPLVTGNLLSVLDVFIKALFLFFFLAIIFERYFLSPLNWLEILIVSAVTTMFVPVFLTSGFVSFVYLAVALTPVAVIGCRQHRSLSFPMANSDLPGNSVKSFPSGSGNLK